MKDTLINALSLIVSLVAFVYSFYLIRQAKQNKKHITENKSKTVNIVQSEWVWTDVDSVFIVSQSKRYNLKKRNTSSHILIPDSSAQIQSFEYNTENLCV